MMIWWKMSAITVYLGLLFISQGASLKCWMCEGHSLEDCTTNQKAEKCIDSCPIRGWRNMTCLVENVSDRFFVKACVGVSELKDIHERCTSKGRDCSLSTCFEDLCN